MFADDDDDVFAESTADETIQQSAPVADEDPASPEDSQSVSLSTKRRSQSLSALTKDEPKSPRKVCDNKSITFLACAPTL